MTPSGTHRVRGAKWSLDTVSKIETAESCAAACGLRNKPPLPRASALGDIRSPIAGDDPCGIITARNERLRAVAECLTAIRSKTSITRFGSALVT